MSAIAPSSAIPPLGSAAASNQDAGARTRILHALILVGAVAMVYSRALGFNFLAWDDTAMVAANPFLHPVSLANLGYLWTHGYYGLYAPLTYSVYAALAAISHLMPLSTGATGVADLSPIPFHAASIALHAGCVLIVYAILRRLTGADIGALAGALLFALHPVQVEPVAWIGSLDTVLSALFSLICIWLYIRHAQAEIASDGKLRHAWLAAASAMFVLALLAKPSAVPTPVIAAVIAVGLIHRPLVVVAKELAPWLVVAAAWIVLTGMSQPFTLPYSEPIWTRPFVAGDSLAFYFAKLVLPLSTSADYGRSPHWLLQHWWAYVTWLIPAGIAALAWMQRCVRPYLLVGAAIWAAALAPVLGLAPFAFQQYSTVADRYLYLAMLGPACASAYLLAQAGTVTKTVMVALSICAAAISIAFVPDWKSSAALFAHAVSANPDDAMMRYDLGFSLSETGDLAGARTQFEAALALEPNFAQARYNLAGVLAQQNQVAASTKQYELALADKPDLWQANDGLALNLARSGHVAEAVKHWQAALKANPLDAIAQRNLTLAARRTHPVR